MVMTENCIFSLGDFEDPETGDAHTHGELLCQSCLSEIMAARRKRVLLIMYFPEDFIWRKIRLMTRCAFIFTTRRLELKESRMEQGAISSRCGV